MHFLSPSGKTLGFYFDFVRSCAIFKTFKAQRKRFVEKLKLKS